MTDTPSSVLRQAAARVRELAAFDTVTLGRWAVRERGEFVYVAGEHGGEEYDVAWDITDDDARWIAALSPVIAEPLAALLDNAAREVDGDGVHYLPLLAHSVARLILEATDGT